MRSQIHAKTSHEIVDINNEQLAIDNSQYRTGNR